MRTIITINHTEHKIAKDGRKYQITHAMLDDGTECEGFGLDFHVGDEVECFFHWNKVKMRRPDWDNLPDPLPELD